MNKMQYDPYETAAPQDSLIAERLSDADFYDAWSVRNDQVEHSALEHFIAAATKTPRWIETCMNLRNRTVALFGLKNLGELSTLQQDKPAADYQPGERIGIFTLFENTFDEALLGDQDKHLDVTLSVHRRTMPEKNQVEVTITTVVHTKNMLGRIYMLPVKPMHRIIAPTVLRAISYVPNK